MPRVTSAIPVGTQFSPDLVNLSAFIEVIHQHAGNRAKLVDAIWDPAVRRRQPNQQPTARQRSLPLEAAVQYGLVERATLQPTPVATSLRGLDPAKLNEAFARHILLELGGQRILEAIQQMNADRLAVSGDSLARYLTAQGFPVTEHNTAINSLRMWLAQAGIFPLGRSGDAWKPNLVVRDRILGLDEDAIDLLVSLNEKQVAFVLALCRREPSGWCDAAEIRDDAETISGVHFGRGSLPKEALDDLQRLGIIEYRTKGTSGGKASELRTTDLFKREVLEKFLTITIKHLDPVATAYYKKRPADIFAELDSPDTYLKGQALEALAVLVMRRLGLRFIEWRKRGRDTAGCEVDAELAGVFGPVPTRWQIQCKNTTTNLPLEDVAKETGILPITLATHVLIITRGSIGRPAREFARDFMQKSPATIFLLDKSDFEKLRENPDSIVGILRDKAREILRSQYDG